MSGSWRIATVRGIDIKVHWSFILILVYGAWAWSRIAERDSLATGWTLAAGAVYGAFLVLTLFTFVVLHELGHSLAAQFFRIPVKDVTLLPVGGVARLERMPESSFQELVVSSAGPLVNFLLVLVLLPFFGVVVLREDISSVAELGLLYTQLSLSGFITYALLTNLLLGLFNLIPAFPMDGGRILRALLAMIINYEAATRAAVLVGRALAVGMGLWGFIRTDVFLILIAVFIYVGAGQEASEVRLRQTLRRTPAGDAYNRNVMVIGAGQPVAEVVNTMLTSYQSDFAVMVGHQLVGVLTRERVLSALRAGHVGAPVGEIMDRDVLRVSATDSLYEVRLKMVQMEKSVAAVFDDRDFLGLLSVADISEAFLLLEASHLKSRSDRKSQSDDDLAPPP